MDSITQESAELKPLVNFHGCVKPTGERRTWPNLITREAVYGNEHFLSGESGARRLSIIAHCRLQEMQ